MLLCNTFSSPLGIRERGNGWDFHNNAMISIIIGIISQECKYFYHYRGNFVSIKFLHFELIKGK